MELHKYLQRKKKNKKTTVVTTQEGTGLAGPELRRGARNGRQPGQQASRAGSARAEGGASEALPYQRPTGLAPACSLRLLKTRLYLWGHLLAFIKIF